MLTTQLDPDLRAKLHGLSQPVAVVDETGRAVGYVLPREVYRDLLVAWSEAVLPDAELDRRAAELGEGQSLAEFWQTLRQPQ
jgi:hypothetical protein